jgi:hypothetical protein
MNISWTTTNELGEVVTHNHPTITTENAHSYAKQTCHTCWGKGYNTYDNGYEYFSVNENEHSWIERRRSNERAILCDCSIRTIQRTGL